MYTEEVIERSDNTVSKFCETSQRKPNRAEVRRMIGHALQEAIKTAMQNHIYTFDDIARQQNEGGAIGNKLTGAMVKVFVSRCTRAFRARVANAAKNIQCAVVGYEKMFDKSGKELRSVYRPREWQAGERRKKKLISKTAWFRPQDTVMFVPVTPNGELTRRGRC